MHVLHGIGCVWSGGNSAQLQAYLDRVAALVAPRPDGVDGYVLVNATEQQPTKDGSTFAASVAAEVAIIVAGSAGDQLRQAILDRISANLAFAVSIFEGGSSMTVVEMQ